MEKTISGIKCEVKNCIHHTENDCCTADHILVADKTAMTKEETACRTFSCECGCK